MKNIGIKLAAVAALALAPTMASAGKGGSAAAIEAAVQTTSTAAIIAEVERAEGLMCEACIETMTRLTEDAREPVREVAAWWFAKRPALRDMLATQFSADLPSGNTIKVRNAADFLGGTKTFTALPGLRATIHRGGLGVEARLALVRAVRTMAHPSGNEVLTTAMADADSSVRAAAVDAWREVLGQTSAAPVVALLVDGDARVRASAAGAVGGLRDQSARGALEALVVRDPDSTVRRNAAWALGRLGNAASRAALLQAITDTSGIVRGVARASLAALK
jgi:hypothetical protein